MSDPKGPQLYEPEARRAAARPDSKDRRRTGWRDFRQSYPGFIATLAIAFFAMVAIDAVLIYKRSAYNSEIGRLRGDMSQAERKKTDLIIQAEEDKVRVALELARRQAKIDKRLHLSVAVDSSRMYLERDGAVLREIVAEIGPEGKVAVGSDSVTLAVARGERTVAQVTPQRISLDGGIVIDTPPGGTSASKSGDSAGGASRVPPGTIRISNVDMSAIRPNLSAGMKVYFY